MVLEQCRGRAVGIREIQEKIYDYKLKDIKMNKQAENVLKTMLSHHANMSNCPFYKVKDRTGYYALKKDLPGYIETDPSPLPEDVEQPSIDVDEDSNGSANSLKRSARRKGILTNGDSGSRGSSPAEDMRQGAENTDTDVKKKTITNKALASAMSRRSNSYTGSALQKSRLLSRRRTSSPGIIGLPQATLRNRSSARPVHRSRSTNCFQRSLNQNSNGKPRTLPILDLETPSSVLTNTRIKSVINSATFSMLPASYQYQLIQLLPKVDRELDTNGVPRMTRTALNNEFFSQALQDWVTQLSEGEFTRETQARIMQELAKERSRISPWKEKFFEEYYGQRTEVKRTRSRSHDATSNLADISFEAQVAKFQHLRDALNKEAEDEDGDVTIDISSDSDSENDPDFRSQADGLRMNAPKRYVPETAQNEAGPKPINRRKINKPFKRPAHGLIKGQPQLALMHHRNAPLYRPLVTNRSSFQVRDELYRSDSDVSDTGELSDSNSFHQHDDTDEEGESSDGMMNVGDDNLLDAGEDSESDEFEGMQDEMQQNAVVAEHSYTRLPNLKRRRKSSEEAEWRRLRQANVTSAMMTKDDSRLPPAGASNNTLVLRPRGNVGQTVQAMNYSEDSSSTSPEQSFKKSCLTQPMFGKILTVSKAETSREERVGVLFGRGMQPSPHGFHGDSVIPRITMTSSLLSSQVTPTTVCTSSSRIGEAGPPGTEESEPGAPIMSCQNSADSLKLPERTNHGDWCFHQGVGGGLNPDENTGRTQNSRTSAAAKSRNSNVQASSNIAEVSAAPSTRKISDNVDRTTLAASVPASSPNSINSPASGVSMVKDSVIARTAAESRRSLSPVLMTKSRLPSTVSGTAADTSFSKTSNSTGQTQSMQGVKRSAPSSGSPVKRTRTLAEIKAQMKAKRLAAATASPTGSPVKPGQFSARGSPAKPSPHQMSAQKAITPNVAIARLAFEHSEGRPETAKMQRTSPILQSEARPVSSRVVDRTEAKPEPGKTTGLCDDTAPISNTDIVQSGPEENNRDSSPKLPGKIILRIKSEEGKQYTVRLNPVDKPSARSSTDSEEEEIVRKRKLSHVILSSGESSDDLMAAGDATAHGAAAAGATTIKPMETYSMLNQLAPPAYSGKAAGMIDHHSLLKRTQKSPVFGEPAFEGLSQIPKKGPTLGLPTAPDALKSDKLSESENQPFMSNKPVIGFQDIPSCTALSSNTPAFVPPPSIISSAQDTQKYRSTSKGKSLVQMQQLARTNRIQSDESELAESESEDENDSTVSTTSSAEESSHFTRKTRSQTRDAPIVNNVNHSEQDDIGSECEGSYSSSSTDDHPVITDCICACKRLVLCKGCGAYTHEECLSSSSLCSLCV